MLEELFNSALLEYVNINDVVLDEPKPQKITLQQNIQNLRCLHVH